MIERSDIESLIRDKYAGDRSRDMAQDLARLEAGEPLAYVIGWMPFLSLSIGLGSRPLIPRPETEWWTEQLVAHLKERFGTEPFALLDLCAGSGAIGLAVLSAFPAARVSFGELHTEHASQIRENLRENGLDAARADIRESDVFEAFAGERFDVIAANPPYIPSTRPLEKSVLAHEPADALYAGTDGLDVIREIAGGAVAHLKPQGELWMECDIANIDEAVVLLREGGAAASEIRTDPYGRPRVVVADYA